MHSAPPSPSQRPPVARHPSAPSLLKRPSSARNLYKMKEKAANHDAMMKKFNLRKMSDNLGIPSKFARREVVIDKAIGPKLQRRFSLRRSIRSMTGVKARRNLFRTLTSPITPKSWTSTCHGILMLVVYHFQLIYLPFVASYYGNGSFGLTVTAIVLEFIFLLDLALNFNTAYVEQGVFVTSRGKIARNYIRSWFLFDLFSALPVQLIHYISTGEFTNDTVRGVQISLIVLRLLRVAVLERGVLVSRVMRVASRFTEWVRYSRYSHLLGIAQLMWLVLLIAHYMACFWHVVARKDLEQTQSVTEKYVADYYYAVSLIQGQGNAGGSLNENLFSSVAIIAGSVILAIVFGNVAMLVSNFNANTTNYHRKMEAVYETMEKMDLPLRLRERVNEYYQHVWLEYESLDGNINQFQKELTHTLGIEIGLYKHMDLVVQVRFWNDCTPDFLTQIVLNLGVRVYMPDDYVVRRREIGSEMMMINRGYCKLSRPSEKEDQDLPTGDVMHHDDVDDVSDSCEFSSDEDKLEAFGAGMFGPSMDSRRWSVGGPDLNPSDFTGIRRFRNAHPRRPSHPEGTEKKHKKYREYMHPGQAFGEMGLLMNYKRTANIRAITFVEMCVLSRKDFQDIISRYPEDRRRVLTSMLESCIEKKVIPFPWESIIEAVIAKRRTSGKKDTSRASVIATMTAKEAARTLVEAIDINAPDETIKYGFQNYEQEFVDDSSLRHANSTDAKISGTLRRNSSLRSTRSFSSRNSRTEESDDNTPPLNEITRSIAEASTANQTDRTLKQLVSLVQSMADNIVALQQEVRELKEQPKCGCDGTTKTANSQMEDPKPIRSIVPAEYFTTKEDFQDQLSRKPSFAKRSPMLAKKRSTNEGKMPIAVLRRIRSKTQDAVDISHDQGRLPVGQTTSPRTEVGRLEGVSPRTDADRYPVNLSSRSRAGRNETLADQLWKRSNTSGDMLKHTDEERTAARRKREMRTRLSLPSEITTKQAEDVPVLDPNAQGPRRTSTPWIPVHDK